MIRRATLVFACLCALTACSGAQALKVLAGGGPKLSANVQAGKTNSQTIGTTRNTDQKIIRPQARTIRQHSDENKVSAERIERITVNEVPTWMIWALVAAVFLDSPLRWPGQIIRLIRRRRAP